MKNNNQNTIDMTNSNNVVNDENFAFLTKTVNPSDLKVAAELALELGEEMNEFFVGNAKHFGFYKKPVVDKDNNVLTNAAEVLAAQANGVVSLEVFETEMNEVELKRFIAFTHTFHRKNLFAAYQTVCFYREYLKTPEGKLLAASTKGQTQREKIARLMSTSDGTIKRIIAIGDYNSAFLSQIDQNNMSFKQVEWEISEAEMKENAAKRKDEKVVAQANNNIIPKPEIAETSANGASATNTPGAETSKTEEPGTTNEPINVPATQPEAAPVKTSDVRPFPVPEHQKPQFVSGNFNVTGVGIIDLSVQNDLPIVRLNDKLVADVEFDAIENIQENAGVATNSFQFFLPDGTIISLSIEKPMKLMKTAA